MNRLSKVILWTFASLVVLAVAAIVALNLYLRSPSARAQIQVALSDALETPLEITSVHLTATGGLKISGIRVPVADAPGVNLAEAQSFSASYRLLPLLSRRLEVTQMTLEKPTLSLRQNADGKWLWPRRARPADDRPKATGEKLKGDSEKLQVIIDGLAVRNGSVNFLKADGQPVVTSTGVNVEFSKVAANDLAGVLRAATISWGGMTAEDVATPFSFKDGVLELNEIVGELAEGELRGTLQLQTNEPESPIAMTAKVSKVSLGMLTAKAGWAQPGTVTGELRGEAQMRGSAKAFTRGKGTAHLVLERGHLQQLELFQTIGQVLEIDELASMRLTESTADVRIADEKAFVESLVLATPDIRITAKGVARFDDKLIMDARLAVSERLGRRLPKVIGESFTEEEGAGFRGMDFKVSGNVSNPKTDLAGKLVGRKVGGEVQELIGGLFGSKKKKKEEKDEKKSEEKKKKEAATSLAAPAPSGAPAEGESTDPAAGPALPLIPLVPESSSSEAAPAER